MWGQKIKTNTGKGRKSRLPAGAQSSGAGGAVAAGAPSVCTPVSGRKNKMCDASAIPECTGCGIIVSAEVRALQRDRCAKDDKWKCIECLGISGEVYDALLDCKELSWFCKECSEQVPKGKEEREDRVVGLLEKVLDRLSNLGPNFQNILR